MEKIIKKILQKIENEGYEAYLVGGFVRDYLLGINSCDIDICTNALPKDLHKIFPNTGNSNNYGGFNIKIKKYNVDITTYRKEISYESRRPTEIEYIDNVLEDLQRRDFTINAICMNKSGLIIDPLKGIDDIHSRSIRVIGNVDQKFKEDPLRMLRAIRFSTLLNFELDPNIKISIKENCKLIDTLSKERIKEEISKILLSKNCLKGLRLFEELNINKIINLSYQNVKLVSDPLVMWSQITCDKIPFTNVEKDYIIKIQRLINYGKIDNKSLYLYGLYLNTAVAEYLDIDKKIVNKLFAKLPIKNEKELNISSEEIMKLLNIKPSKILKELKNELIDKILSLELKNNKNELKKYIINNKERWIHE